MINKEIMPNLFIVGAAKSGSSLLADCLGQHPEIFFSKVKEPFYFVPDFGMNSWEEYMSLFKNAGGNKYCGEASTGYLYSEEAAKRLHAFNASAKIIIILRSPVEMSFSLWQFMKRQGNETREFLTAFNQDLNGENSHFAKSCVGWHENYAYYNRALYFNQVMRYRLLFGDDNVHVICFEHFVKNPKEGFVKIFDFLGVNNNFMPTVKMINEGGGVRSIILQKLSQKKYPFLKKIVPVEARDFLRSVVRKINVDSNKKMQLENDLRVSLRRYYKQDVVQLHNFLKKTYWNEYGV